MFFYTAYVKMTVDGGPFQVPPVRRFYIMLPEICFFRIIRGFCCYRYFDEFMFWWTFWIQKIGPTQWAVLALQKSGCFLTSVWWCKCLAAFQMKWNFSTDIDTQGFCSRVFLWWKFVWDLRHFCIMPEIFPIWDVFFRCYFSIRERLMPIYLFLMSSGAQFL